MCLSLATCPLLRGFVAIFPVTDGAGLVPGPFHAPVHGPTPDRVAGPEVGPDLIPAHPLRGGGRGEEEEVIS